MNKKLYYIEDEPYLGKIVAESLEHEGFDVTWETDGAKVLQRFIHYTPDLVILDIMLPHTDGYSLCREIRRRFPDMPVIFLTAKVETKDLVKGFEAGGTDYIRKPFSIEELMVRIQNQFNLAANHAISTLHSDPITLGRFTLSKQTYELTGPDGVIKLSQRDMEILGILVCNQNQVIDRKELLMKVWGDDSFFNSRNLDVYIRKIRGLFAADPSIRLQTLKGKGYLLLVGHQPGSA